MFLLEWRERRLDWVGAGSHSAVQRMELTAEITVTFCHKLMAGWTQEMKSSTLQFCFKSESYPQVCRWYNPCLIIQPWLL